MANINYNKLAMDIYDFCNSYEMWDDTTIYFDGKAFAPWSEWEGENGLKIGHNLYLYENKCVTDYLQYVNPDGLSCAFEGGLYDLINDWGMNYGSLYEKFCNIFNKYGLYFELGHSYYLTTAEL